LYDQGVAGWHPRLLFAGLFDSLVAKSIRDKLGGQLEFVVVGGAPLSEAVARTFLSLGVPLLQGYGLTEASPVVSVNTLSKNRPNSIGMLLRGVAAKLMDNDELWVRGENVMQGYWQTPQASNATIVEEAGERWLKTGDRASIDEQGFIRIIGRIKDILVLANGEKVPPSDIEAAIIQNPLFEQALVIGEGKSFLSALVVLNAARFHQLCQDNGWLETDLTSAPLQDYLVQEIAARMEDFPGYAKVRKVTVCAEEWTIESGLLTPTLKKKRSKIIQHYQQTIAAMYDGHGIHAS
jgi:long-chain acyl-CoA synthetase